MTDINKPHPPSQSHDGKPSEGGRTLLIGVLGGLISAAGYTVYNRLPEDQKDRLHGQVRGLVESKVAELRTNLSI